MVLDRAAGPVILKILVVGHSDLGRDVPDYGAWYIVTLLREAAFVM